MLIDLVVNIVVVAKDMIEIVAVVAFEEPSVASVVVFVVVAVGIVVAFVAELGESFVGIVDTAVASAKSFVVDIDLVVDNYLNFLEGGKFRLWDMFLQVVLYMYLGNFAGKFVDWSRRVLVGILNPQDMFRLDSQDMSYLEVVVFASYCRTDLYILLFLLAS